MSQKLNTSERINCYFNVCVSAIENLGNETVYAGINCAIAFAKVIHIEKEKDANAALLFRMFYQRCTANQSNEACIAGIVNQCFSYGGEQDFLFRCMHVLTRICTSVYELEDRSGCVTAVRSTVRRELVNRCNQSEYEELCVSH